MQVSPATATPSLTDAAGRLFNPRPCVTVLHIAAGRDCVVVDDALANPHGVVAWAASQAFHAPNGYPYPGVVLPAPGDFAARAAEFFALHARPLLGGRRTLDATVRLSLVTTPPERLEPRQWQCHRDRVVQDERQLLYAASVLYLFEDPALGGTSFYAPRGTPAQTDRLQADSQMLDGPAFAARYGVTPGYMTGSNAYFEQLARVPAAWNRMIFYDGGMFHSADVDAPLRLVEDVRRGRFTVNGFFTCRRNAG